VLAFAHVMDLLTNVLAGLCRGCLALSTRPGRTLPSSLLRHDSPPLQGAGRCIQPAVSTPWVDWPRSA
jgi:hypothetical protein